jgi:hypothetical protein
MQVERNVARAFGGTLLLATLALAMEGCGPEYIYFRPAENPEASSPGWVAQGKYGLPPGAPSVQVEISARGVVEKQKKAEEKRMLEVRFSVRNRGPVPWTLDPATAKIVDDEGRTTVGARAYQDKNAVGATTLGGGTRGTFLLVFDMPANVRFEAIGSLRVIWPYRCGDRAFEAETKFIRIEEVAYYYPDYYPYPYYAPYPYPPYGPYYYGPGYYDPWYGPYGRGYYRRH